MQAKAFPFLCGYWKLTSLETSKSWLPQTDTSSTISSEKKDAVYLPIEPKSRFIDY